MRAISLFSGAGGLDLGCEDAGFQTVAAVELNDTARRTLAINGPGFFSSLSPAAMYDDVTAMDWGDLMDAAEVSRGEIELVHGGPPCTPFSKSGYWLEYKRDGNDPKASLLDSFVDAIAAVQPKAFLMENVTALWGKRSRPIFERFLTRAATAGYATDYRVLLAADFGVPQNRQRLVTVGVRADLLDDPRRTWGLEWPRPTHAGPHETRSGWDETLPLHVGAGPALEGLDGTSNPPEPGEHVVGTYAEELRSVPPGDNYLWWTAHRGHPDPRFEWRKRYWSFLLKLHPDRPSPTIQGQPGPWVGPFHWDNRRLRVAELKRLMGFPDDFVVAGSRREQQLQLGNAVPPRLGALVARALRAELDSLTPRSRGAAYLAA